MIAGKSTILFMVLFLVLGQAQAQWVNPNIAREYARPEGPFYCRPSKRSLDNRQDFLEGLNRENKKLLDLAKKTVRLTKDTLEDMEAAHLASDVAEVVSSVAGLAAGGMAIRALYFSGKNVAFLGMTIKSGSVAAHAYSAYSLASNGWPLAKLGLGALSKDQSPEELLALQMAQYQKEGLLSAGAKRFILATDFSGSSELIESPLIEGAMKRLMEFYDQQKKRIGDKNTLWQSLGEFWHEKGLKQSRLDYAVAKEAKMLQEMRVLYIDLLIELIKRHRDYCYTVSFN